MKNHLEYEVFPSANAGGIVIPPGIHSGHCHRVVFSSLTRDQVIERHYLHLDGLDVEVSDREGNTPNALIEGVSIIER